MRPITNSGPSKRKKIEQALGGSIDDFLNETTRRGMSQEEIAAEIERQTGIHVSRSAVCNWLKAAGYRSFIVYKRGRRAA